MKYLWNFNTARTREIKDTFFHKSWQVFVDAVIVSTVQIIVAGRNKNKEKNLKLRVNFNLYYFVGEYM